MIRVSLKDRVKDSLNMIHIFRPGPPPSGDVILEFTGPVHQAFPDGVKASMSIRVSVREFERGLYAVCN